MAYSIWLEFEQYENPPLEDTDGFCNIAVIYDDGRRQAYNVWSLAFFQDSIQEIVDEVEQHGFATSPDVIVRKLTRQNIEDALRKLLPQE